MTKQAAMAKQAAAKQAAKRLYITSSGSCDSRPTKSDDAEWVCRKVNIHSMFYLMKAAH
jgi:hypothetical protein